MSYYYLADIEVKANKLKEYHDWWPTVGVDLHLEAGAEHVGTWNVICGSESTTHVKRLFKILDLNEWAKGEKNFMYHDDYWNSLAYDVKTTLLVPEPYSPLK